MAEGSIPVTILNSRAARILGGTAPATVLLFGVGRVTALAVTAILRLPLAKFSVMISQFGVIGVRQVP
jgi:hypothetical protein